jgi:hypothetical protein
MNAVMCDWPVVRQAPSFPTFRSINTAENDSKPIDGNDSDSDADLDSRSVLSAQCSVLSAQCSAPSALCSASLIVGRMAYSITTPVGPVTGWLERRRVTNAVSAA